MMSMLPPPVIDSDKDGIPDDREVELGLNPNSNDSDGDGILDGDEIGDVDNPADTDGDGTIDALDLDSDNDADDDDNDGTDPQDLASNSLSQAIIGHTKYSINSNGAVGNRSYVDYTYTGLENLNNGILLNVSGVYEIFGDTLTLTRVSPSDSTLQFDHLNTKDGVMYFSLTIDEGEVMQSRFYDTAEERDCSMQRVNPALIMYLLN